MSQSCVDAAKAEQEGQEIDPQSGLPLDGPFYRGRCVKCNGDTYDELAPSEVAGLVPEKTRKFSSCFWRCSTCKQVFWPGPMYAEAVQVILDAAKGAGLTVAVA